MVRLTPMTDEEFAVFTERETLEYAKEQVRAGYSTESEAVEKSRKEHQTLLPDGVKTRTHYIYTIREAEGGETVGAVWLRATLDSPRPSGFIFDLEIHEPFRRKGYARQAMLELEEVARGMGLQQLGLHVFAHNQGARALYEGLGYTVSSLNMLKPLSTAGN
jgi:ribosomal protein S18 acetylase RimI-like enzyme